jgi:hypothetical protein
MGNSKFVLSTLYACTNTEYETHLNCWKAGRLIRKGNRADEYDQNTLCSCMETLIVQLNNKLKDKLRRKEGNYINKSICLSK